MNIKFEMNYDESRTKSNQRIKILQTSYQLFVLNGIEKVDMKDIAKACGIQRRSLYNYYSQKEQIARDIMRCWYNSFPKLQMHDTQSGVSGFEYVTEILHQFYELLMQNSDAICYSVHFDHYFQNDYGDLSFRSFLSEQLKTLHDTSLFERGVSDGSIKPEYRGREQEIMSTITTSIIALSQRIMFRKNTLRQEGGYSEENIRVLIELLLAAIKN